MAPNLDPARLLGILQAVRQQVDEHLLHSADVGAHVERGLCCLLVAARPEHTRRILKKFLLLLGPQSLFEDTCLGQIGTHKLKLNCNVSHLRIPALHLYHLVNSICQVKRADVKVYPIFFDSLKI